MIYGPYPAVVTGIHDGDTLTLDIDQGFGTHQVELRCRLYGINAPELATVAGKKARDFLTSIVAVGERVAVSSHGWDKYGGRFDGIVVAGGIDLGEAMLRSGNAKVYP